MSWKGPWHCWVEYESRLGQTWCAWKESKQQALRTVEKIEHRESEFHGGGRREQAEKAGRAEAVHLVRLHPAGIHHLGRAGNLHRYPEIYTLVARELDVPAEQCLVIEDSLNGVKAALAAGMFCLAVTTDFTSAQVHAGGLLDPRWIIDEPGELLSVTEAFIKEHDVNQPSNLN